MPETRIVRSSCRMCHGVCQVRVHLEDDRVVAVTGDPESPISAGYLCRVYPGEDPIRAHTEAQSEDR